MKTKLHYLDDMSRLTCEAVVLSVEKVADDSFQVLLDRTAFYPRGGGQPSEIGTVVGEDGVLLVGSAFLDSGGVVHSGQMQSGALVPGQLVKVNVDPSVRRLHSRIHSAGELICACVRELGRDWLVAGASHYPGVAKITYAMALDAFKRHAFGEEVRELAAKYIAESLPVRISVTTDRAKVRDLCGYDPDYIPIDEPVRIVQIGSLYARPCMGTHVDHAGQIGSISIRSIGCRSGQTMIGYDVLQ
jgi:Ser-tRNA(Ala) deacylase AlaX